MTTIQESWKDAKKTPLDFIIVGGGAGGAPLAARLVERGYTVLVVEMGPEKPAPAATDVVEDTEVPLLHGESTEDERHALRFFVKHFDADPSGSLDPKIHIDDKRRDETGIFYPRAQGIGGCTVHNAMITICGPSEDWDEIAELTGDESWRGDRMRAYFERLENCQYDRPSFWSRLSGFLGFGTGWENARHGHRGWLQTSLSDLRFLEKDKQLLKVVLGGALEAVKSGTERIGGLVWSALRGRLFPELDPNHWDRMQRNPEGVARIPCAITGTGERSSPRERLLGLTASPHAQRLHLLTGACVTEVILEMAAEKIMVGGLEADRRARGIRCLLRPDVYEARPQAKVLTDDAWRKDVIELRCRREVILCGGAFNTPQLLMLSGIGPKGHLTAAEVNKDRKPENRLQCIQDLAGVGDNLQDRYEVPVIAKLADRFHTLDGLGLSSSLLDAELERWKQNRGRPAFERGLYATNGGLISIFLRSHQEDSVPDLFIFAAPGRFPGYAVKWSTPGSLVGIDPDAKPKVAAAAPHRQLTWIVLKARTRHHGGTVRLQSAHPFRRPEINFRSFPLADEAELDANVPSSDLDLEALHEGVAFIKDAIKIGMNDGTIAEVELPGCKEHFGDKVRKWIKHIAWGHHACGTCKIGSDTDPSAVLDSRFRVRGVQGLRVVDASVFPRIFGYFIFTNVYMAAEKAADVLTEDHPLDPASLSSETRAALLLDPVLPSSAVFEARRLYPAEMEEAEARLIAKRREAAGLSR